MSIVFLNSWSILRIVVKPFESQNSNLSSEFKEVYRVPTQYFWHLLFDFYNGKKLQK